MVSKSSKKEAPAGARIRVSPVVVGGVLFGVVSFLLGLASYAITDVYRFWGVTTAESQMGGAFWRALGLPVDQLGYYKEFGIPHNPLNPGWNVDFGIILGSLLYSLATRRFQLIVPNKWLAAQAVAGGILIGYGTRLAAGCNIGNFVSGWADGSIWAPVFLVSMLAGLYVGWKFIVERHLIYRAGPSKLVRVGGRARLAAAIATAAAATAMFLASDAFAKARLAAGLAFGAIGAAFGICFYTSYRETVNYSVSVKRGGYEVGMMVPGIVALVLTYAVLSQIAILGLGLPAEFSEGMKYGLWHRLIGGFIFGIGMALAANCVYSPLWRLGTGNLYAGLTILATVLVGTQLLALSWDWWKAVLGALPQPPMFDPYYRWSLYKFGVPGAAAMDLMLIAWLLWWRKAYR
ncbi:MAG: YeeE/YedE family protein [Thermoproteus sp.]|nr:YeeE/YedE family protein [Thermoproteus sp.]